MVVALAGSFFTIYLMNALVSAAVAARTTCFYVISRLGAKSTCSAAVECQNAASGVALAGGSCKAIILPPVPATSAPRHH